MIARLLPRSLIGQTLLAIAVTLFAVQGANGYLAYTIEQERHETALVNTLAFRLVAAQRIGRGDAADARTLARALRRGGARPGRAIYARMANFAPLPGDRAREDFAARLRETLSASGRDPSRVVVVQRALGDDPQAMARWERRAARRGEQMPRMRGDLLVAAISESADGSSGWEVVRTAMPPRFPRFGALIPLAQALVLALLLSGVLWLVLRRITRPLAELRARTERFSMTAAPAAPLVPRGPDDVARLIAAHNAMEARIGAMIAEKDVMLGAIGHDLKTPLAALRVRIEAVEDEGRRASMAATVEEVVRTLDEILDLARMGRADAPPERAELFALAASVVEEFEDMGDPVTIADGPRITAPVHIVRLKRGLRNLVSNAVRYGGGAGVSVLREAGAVVLRVEDDGPGIPENRLAAMLEPFVRGEESRNRATGGAGLGLTLARAVAEHHGGALAIANRPGGGLVAEIRLPG